MADCIWWFWLFKGRNGCTFWVPSPGLRPSQIPSSSLYTLSCSQPLLNLSTCLERLLCTPSNTSERLPLHFPRPPYMSHSLPSLLSPRCSRQHPPISQHDIWNLYHQTHQEHFILMYPSFLNFLRLVPCFLSVCLPSAKWQMYRKCLMNSEINKERNDVGEEEVFFFSFLFVLFGLIQYLILQEI